MDPDKKMEEIMNARYIPEMRSNLAERIIEASRHHQARGESGIMLWVNTFTDAFMLPRPAYVLTMIFVLGLLLGGVSGYGNISAASEATTDYSDLLLSAEDVSEGDWL